MIFPAWPCCCHKRLLCRVDGVERVVMRTALGCPEALGLWGCPMYRDGGRGAAASWFLRRVWCTQKALTNGYVKPGRQKTALGGSALWPRTQGPDVRREPRVDGATARSDNRDSSDVRL